MARYGNQSIRYSPYTNVCDTSPIVRKYLASIGNTSLRLATRNG